MASEQQTSGTADGSFAVDDDFVDDSPAGDASPRGPTTPPGTTDLIAELWEAIKEKPGEALGYPTLVVMAGTMVQFVFAFTVYFGFSVVGGLAGGVTGGANEAAGSVVMMTFIGVGALLMLAIFIVGGGLVVGGTSLVWLRVLRGQSVELKHLKRIKDYAVPLIVAGGISGAAAFVGYLFLIVPGIVIGLGLAMSHLLVVDKGLSGTEAVRESWELMKGHKLALFVHFLVVGLVAMAAQCITCGAGGVLVMPFQIGAWTLFYDYLVEPGNAYMEDSPSGIRNPELPA